jgi:hypothetical protein
MSRTSMSASLPVETSFEKPTPRAVARDSNAPRTPPLCDTSPIRPCCSGFISSADDGDPTRRDQFVEYGQACLELFIHRLSEGSAFQLDSLNEAVYDLSSAY